MEMHEVLLATFSIGVLTKFVDMVVDDGLNVQKPITYTASVAYGILIAYVVANYPLLAPLGLAVVVAVLLAKKIDSKPHIVGVVSMGLFLLLLGLPRIDLILFAIFVFAGGLDEVLSDMSDTGKIKGVLAKVFEKRIILEIVTFLVSFATGYWLIFLAMLSYDTGYFLVKKSGRYFKYLRNE